MIKHFKKNCFLIILGQILSLAWTIIVNVNVLDFDDFEKGFYTFVFSVVFGFLSLNLILYVIKWAINRSDKKITNVQQEIVENSDEVSMPKSLSEEQKRIIANVSEKAGLSSEDLIELAREIMEQTEDFLGDIEYHDTLAFVKAIIELIELGFTAKDFYQD